jgi:hypothetical protein
MQQAEAAGLLAGLLGLIALCKVVPSQSLGRPGRLKSRRHAVLPERLETSK